MKQIDPRIREQLTTKILAAGASHAAGMLIHHGCRRTKGQTAKEALTEAIQEVLKEAIGCGLDIGYDMGAEVYGAE